MTAGDEARAIFNEARAAQGMPPLDNRPLAEILSGDDEEEMERYDDDAPAHPQEIAALIERAEKAEKRNRHLEHVARCQREMLNLKYGETSTDAIRRVVAERDALTALIPATWYAERDAAWRLEALVDQWRRLIDVNQRLQDQRDAATKILDHANRAIDERRAVIEELTASTEAAEAECAAMRAAGAEILQQLEAGEFCRYGDHVQGICDHMDYIEALQPVFASNSGVALLAELAQLRARPEASICGCGDHIQSGDTATQDGAVCADKLRAEREAAQRVLSAAEAYRIAMSARIRVEFNGEEFADRPLAVEILDEAESAALQEMIEAMRERRAGEGGAR